MDDKQREIMINITSQLIDIEFANILKNNDLKLYNQYFTSNGNSKGKIFIDYGVVDGDPKITLDINFLSDNELLRCKAESKVNEYTLKAYKALLEK